MRLTKRLLHHAVFGVVTIGALILWVSELFGELPPMAVLIILLVGLLSGGLWAAYTYGWEYARHFEVALLTLLIGLGMPDVLDQYDIVVLIPPVMALLLTRPRWVMVSAVVLYGIVLVRAGGQGVYANLSNIIEYVIIVAGMLLSGLATDTAQRLADANAKADEARTQAEQQAQQLAQQAHELTQRSEEQQQLLNLVAQLETPAVQLADGVLFVPIVGHLDSRRAQLLTARLLEDAHAQRARLVLLDIAGVSVVDSGVAEALMQAAQSLRLLGCLVFLSGISAEVAATLTQLGMTFEGITAVRNPQEALARYAVLVGQGHGRALPPAASR